jgi:hypothetical protein
MVGAPPGLIRAAAAAAIAVLAQATLAATPSWVVTGSCRDGRSHGAYELRMDGLLRVAGAFNHGKRIGSFLFWSSTGVRLALLPFDDDVMSGTVALWYATAPARGEPSRKLEAVYVAGRPVSARSWYPDGRPRGEFRYDNKQLAEARAWSAKGAPLPDAEARAMAARDLKADEKFYDTLLAIVRDNPPSCDTNGRKS